MKYIIRSTDQEKIRLFFFFFLFIKKINLTTLPALLRLKTRLRTGMDRVQLIVPRCPLVTRHISYHSRGNSVGRSSSSGGCGVDYVQVSDFLKLLLMADSYVCIPFVVSSLFPLCLRRVEHQLWSFLFDYLSVFQSSFWEMKMCFGF